MRLELILGEYQASLKLNDTYENVDAVLEQIHVALEYLLEKNNLIPSWDDRIKEYKRLIKEFENKE